MEPSVTIRDHGRRPARMRVAGAAALALVVLAGCGTPSLLMGSPTEGTPLDAPLEVATAKAQAALAEAQRAYQSGDLLTAFAVANHALRDEPPAELREALRKVRSDARAALVVSRIVRVRAVPDRDAVADGDVATLRVVFRNLSSDRLVIPRTASSSSEALLLLGLTRSDYDVYGNTRTSEQRLRHTLADDLSIPPGGEREIVLKLSDALSTLRHQGFSLIEVSGTFRPVVLQVGESEFFDALPVAPASLHVFQKGYEDVAAAPFEALRKAIAKRSPPHLLVAAELLPPSDRLAALELLDKAIEDDPELAFALQAARTRLEH